MSSTDIEWGPFIEWRATGEGWISWSYKHSNTCRGNVWDYGCWDFPKRKNYWCQNSIFFNQIKFVFNKISLFFMIPKYIFIQLK